MIFRNEWRLLGLPLLVAALGLDNIDPDQPPGTFPPRPTLTDPPKPPAWDDWMHPERGPRNVKNQQDGEWGSITAQTTHADWQDGELWEDPLRKRAWKSEGNWRSPVLGPFSLFGTLGANSEEPETDMKVAGKTGVACKVPLFWAAELTLRSGPSLTYTDPLRPDRTREKSEWLLEIQARWPILAGIGLEYEGAAAPALSPLDKSWVNHDVRIAFPVGNTGKFRVGAKQRWEGLGETRSATDGPQLYIGLELIR
jgi:hypothetical protein